jgi:drug/metabolite transporter (DMT)-like permease
MYSTDVIFGKLALEEMPLFIFVFILSLSYGLLGILLYIYNPIIINNYIKDKKNTKYILYSILAIIVGTFCGDFLRWYSLKNSSRINLPIVMAIIHTVPIFSLFLVYIIYKKNMDYRSIIGIVLSVLGCAIAIIYSK